MAGVWEVQQGSSFNQETDGWMENKGEKQNVIEKFFKYTSIGKFFCFRTFQ